MNFKKDLKRKSFLSSQPMAPQRWISVRLCPPQAAMASGCTSSTGLGLFALFASHNKDSTLRCAAVLVELTLKNDEKVSRLPATGPKVGQGRVAHPLAVTQRVLRPSDLHRASKPCALEVLDASQLVMLASGRPLNMKIERKTSSPEDEHIAIYLSR